MTDLRGRGTSIKYASIIIFFLIYCEYDIAVVTLASGEALEPEPPPGWRAE